MTQTTPETDNSNEDQAVIDPSKPLPYNGWINIKDIIIQEEHYPRPVSGIDEEAVKRYRANIDNLPAILINQDRILVDGRHRIKAHQDEGHTKIYYFRRDLDSEDLIKVAAQLNRGHGKQLEMADKKDLARDWYQKGDITSEIADYLGVSSRTIRNWVHDLKTANKEQRDQEIIELSDEGYSQKEIAKQVGIHQGNISRILKAHQQAETETEEAASTGSVSDMIHDRLQKHQEDEAPADYMTPDERIVDQDDPTTESHPSYAVLYPQEWGAIRTRFTRIKGLVESAEESFHENPLEATLEISGRLVNEITEQHNALFAMKTNLEKQDEQADDT